MLGQNVKTRPVMYRQATAAQFAQENPVLPVGQHAREKDTHRVKFGDGSTAYNELPYQVEPGTIVAKAGVTGATSLNLREGSIFQLTLTGNVTGFTATNLTPGQEVEVHFVQDDPGSRTLAVNSTVVKLAGGALTLTTGAGKRDVLRFRVVGTTLVEIGRSLNI